MTAISTIDSAPPPSSQESSPPSTTWTDVKIQRAWRTAAALIGLVTSIGFGVTALAGKAIYWAAAVPAAAAAALLYRSLNHLYDFQDPAELSAIRSQAAQMPLANLIEKYGWQPLFRYQILSPASFESAYSIHAGKLPFNPLLAFYETAEAERKKAGSTPLQIPALEKWRGKFESETAKMTCSQIVSSYPIDRLFLYKILDEARFSILSEAKAAEDDFARIKTALEQEFTQRTKPQRDLFLTKEDLAKKKYSTAVLESQLYQLHFTYEQSIEAEKRIAQAELRAEQALCQSSDPGLRAAAAARCSAIHQALEIRKSTLFQIYMQGCGAVQAQIASLQQLAQAEIGQAKAEYMGAVRPVRMEIDGRISCAHAELDYHLRKLDESYTMRRSGNRAPGP